MTEQIRTFIAIELPEAVRQALSKLVQRLKGQVGSRVRWVDPERMHLTLKFLGNVEASRIPEVISAAQDGVGGTPGLSLHLEGAGGFPDMVRPRVLWVGLGGDLKTLHALQVRVEQAMVGLGFAAEERSFSPHLTLARLGQIAPAERRRAGEVLSDVTVPRIDFTAREVVVMQSDLRPAGPIYTPLARISLG